MSEIVNAEKIVDEISNNHEMCFSRLERALLESAVLRGAIAQHDKGTKRLDELTEMVDKSLALLEDYKKQMDAFRET